MYLQGIRDGIPNNIRTRSTEKSNGENAIAEQGNPGYNGIIKPNAEAKSEGQRGKRIFLGGKLWSEGPDTGEQGRGQAEGAGGTGKVERPSWRKSELDAVKDFPDYSPQKSFEKMPDGTIKEVSYGTKGSVRPDYYKTGHSVDIKNYNVTTSSGRSSLKNNIFKQYNQRLEALPSGTKQTVVIDVRGQPVTDSVLDGLYNDIIKSTNSGIEIRFKITN